jgi:hypothetical protein
MEPGSSTSSRLELIKVLQRRDYYSQHTVGEYSTGLIQILKFTGCKRGIRKIFVFKFWKEPMLVLKQMILQKKALILSFKITL